MLDANPTAMNNGPVYFDAWRTIKLFAEAGQPPREMPADFEIPDYCEHVLTRVFDALGSMPCEDLIDLTHSEMPWRDAVARAARSGEHVLCPSRVTRWPLGLPAKAVRLFRELFVGSYMYPQSP